MRISCSLTFHVKFKPLIIKIGWELDILCYIFWNSKIWRATFALFLVFLLFLSQFLPDLNEILSKFRENVGLQAYRLGSVLNRSWTGLRTAVFFGLSQKNWEDRDRWSAWTGYSLVRFSVPFRSYEPDLETLSTAYHPQTDGTTERVNQEIEAYLSIYCASHPEEWPWALHTLEFTHNNRRHADRQHTPFELMFGESPIAIPLSFENTKYPSMEEKMKTLMQNREEALAAHELARSRMADRRRLLYASTRVRFHFVLCHSRHLSITTVSLSYVPFIIVYHHLFVFRLSSFSSLCIYSAPVIFRASFLGFVAALSYFNIFTFLWLDNKFIVFVILWLSYLVVLRHFT